MAIVRVALPVAVDQLFDYWSPAGLEIAVGAVVRARLGRRRLVGVAVELSDASNVPPERIDPIDEIAGELPPLPEDLRILARFVVDYYQQPIGQCFAQMLPPLAKRRAQPRVGASAGDRAEAIRRATLNSDQRRALDVILAEVDSFAPSLLQGVTGSGKT